MGKEKRTIEQQITAWEAQRAVKNLMGKYVNTLLLNRDFNVFDSFWAGEEDVCLGFNEGWYRGPEAVKGYFDACRDRNALVASVLRDHFPEKLGGKSDDEIYGMGTMKIYPLYTPVIEVADDGKTAKGLWSCMGSHCDIDEFGPIARYLWGYYAADFIKEEDGWKIWHLQFVHDIDGVVGENWGAPEPEYPELPQQIQQRTSRKLSCQVQAVTVSKERVQNVRAFHVPLRLCPYVRRPSLKQNTASKFPLYVRNL